jgi:hypothetical protein
LAARYDSVMRDILFIAAVIGFFAIAVLFVRACELIVGPAAGIDGERDR